MKDLFYAILIALLLLTIYVGVKNDIQLEDKKFNNLILIEKEHDFLFGYQMTFKHENDSIEWVRVYQIFYDKYNVGDTIHYK